MVEQRRRTEPATSLPSIVMADFTSQEFIITQNKRNCDEESYLDVCTEDQTKVHGKETIGAGMCGSTEVLTPDVPIVSDTPDPLFELAPAPGVGSQSSEASGTQSTKAAIPWSGDSVELEDEAQNTASAFVVAPLDTSKFFPWQIDCELCIVHAIDFY
jgi:hypothetical protein